MAESRYDIVVFGATSFVGRILCSYLNQSFRTDELKWAMAGRSRERLEALRAELDPGGENPPLVVADANDEASLREMCASSRVVVSTVGPYALYGEALVKVCAQSGTDYCDLTGEVQWIRRMIDRYEPDARASGARLVNCCGFDSVPSDLGVFFLQEKAKERWGEYLPHIRMRVRKMKGGASGGTVASLLNLGKEAAADPALRRQLRDPYSICPEGHPLRARQYDAGVEYDETFSSWVGPFIMAGINTRVVHRSNALADAIYGVDFRYDEAMLTGDGKNGERRARRLAMAMKLFMLGTGFGPGRWLMQKFLPKPGEGPGPEAREAGYFDLRFAGVQEPKSSGEAEISSTAASSDRMRRELLCRVSGDRDPGYGSTARMLGQAAVCLAMDTSDTDRAGGFWTPATAFGQKLIDRLEKNAGLRFELIEEK